jgi:hypothetical protein
MNQMAEQHLTRAVANRTYWSMSLLKIAYVANLLILVPVALPTLLSERGASAVFQSKFATDTPFRVLVGCLWTGIMVASAIGLFLPQAMAGVLVVQVVYKSLFLALVIVPLLREKGLVAIPMGVSVSFLAIVLLWPFLLWKSGPWNG